MILAPGEVVVIITSLTFLFHPVVVAGVVMILNLARVVFAASNIYRQFT